MMANIKSATENEDSGSVEKSILLFKTGQLNDIATLHQGFDLQRMPQNYLTKRSYIEKIIYHATMSDAMKSPFSGFTIANRFLQKLDLIDVITGIRTFKALAKLLLDPSKRTSVMIHRIGNTWLLDEFNVDSFLLSDAHSHEWSWLRNFLRKKKFCLCESEFSRDTLVLRDLYVKFLYHTVNAFPHLSLRTIQSSDFPSGSPQKCLPAPEESRISPDSPSTSLNASLSAAETEDGTHRTVSRSRIDASPKRTWFSTSDNYLHMARWKLKDLSFLVGSDLAIFGTPKHPCISLKLSPMHESINVLTGVDIWLENIINEVPEVAMCYHHEGIVMQEYEIYKTCDLPALSGFETKHIYRTVQNLVMFLKRNATQEGHTYWLVKEPGLGVVKLYDLTALCAREMRSAADSDEDDISGANPFIIPVATLCYRLAERRWLDYKALPDRETSEFGSNGVISTDTDHLLDALRLVKNCLNLIHLAETAANSTNPGGNPTPANLVSHGLNDLKTRAVVLLCQLYLTSPFKSLEACARRLLVSAPIGSEVTTLNLDELSAEADGDATIAGDDTSSSGEPNDAVVPQDQFEGRLDHVAHRKSRRLLGSTLIEALRSSDTNRLSQLAVGVLASCSPDMPSEPSPQMVLHSTLSHLLQRSENRCSGQTSSGEMLNSLLPVALLKSYLHKAEDLWLRGHELSCLRSETTTSMPFLQSVFRFTLPSVLVFEHCAPDSYTGLFDNPMAASNNASDISCPLCGSTESKLSAPDNDWITEKGLISSCLFSASLVAYTDEVRRLGWEKASSQIEQFDLEASDTILLRLVCDVGRERLRMLLDAACRGPLDDVTYECTPTKQLQRTGWLDVLHMASRCMYRGLAATMLGPKRSTAAVKPGKHRSPANTVSSPPKTPPHRQVPTATTDNNRSLATRLHLTPNLWPALVSRYIIAIRLKMHLDAQSDEFYRTLKRCLIMAQHPPVRTEQLSLRFQILTLTNLFQLYKIAAASSDCTSSGWHTAALSGELPVDLTPTILPLRTLLWVEDRGGDSTSEPRQCFPLTAVCLARAIESLLQLVTKYKSDRNDTLFHSFHMNLVVACNEYTRQSAARADLPKIKDATYLKTIITVIKQVSKRLPDKLMGDPTRQSQITSEVGSTTMLTQAEIVRLVELRVYLMDITLHWIQCPGVKQSGESFVQTCSTVITQARGAVAWHAKQMSIPTAETKAPLEESVVCGLITFLNLVSRLVRLEVFNADVMSTAWLFQVLKDFLYAKPVVDVFLHRLGSDPGIDSQASVAEVPMGRMLFLLYFICQCIMEKAVAEKMCKRVKRKDRRLICTAEQPNPEVRLASEILGPDGLATFREIDDFYRPISELKIAGAETFVQVCQVLSDRMRIMIPYFSHP